MSEKTLEQAMRSYPAKAKAEVAAIGQLVKGLTLVEKNQEQKLKGGQPM